MWWQEYEDLPPDAPLVQERVEPGSGVVGYEMQGFYGWGERYSLPSVQKKKTSWRSYFHKLFFGSPSAPSSH